ncbi:pyridoxamine 5'-phosphate oxidase family protein [Spongiimicrobium salis]|uniref:pyridoxamine 5'-phosphate oxidase family protein n=1 Tax=Spongiimicrobium salis TaxID=1667022 RepID=UPI00374DEB8B
MANVFHSGELEIQAKFGELEIAGQIGQMIQKSIPPRAVGFLEAQTNALVSSMDASGAIWVSFLIADGPIVTVDGPEEMSINRTKIVSSEHDILYANLNANSEVGLLFIILAERKRYRINGKLKLSETRMKVKVNEAYGNCPKYIQRRSVSVPTTASKSSQIQKGDSLQPHHLEWIKSADTLFLGTQSNDFNMDMSHRGGNPGFVEVIDDGVLKIPDYQGNMMYNSLGNIAQNGKAGLLFVDYKNKRVLQLSGKASLLFDQDGEEDAVKTTGTGRYWLFHTKAWVETDKHHNMDWEYIDASPFNPEIN